MGVKGRAQMVGVGAGLAELSNAHERETFRFCMFYQN